jgi:hypothetical protein
MARLDFDFHARPTRMDKRGAALALAGALALGWAWNAWEAARATEAGLTLQIAALEHDQPRASVSRVASRADDPLARVETQLAYRWQPAFEAMAAARSAKIALVSLDAVQAKSQVKLVAEARQLADAVAFVDALQQQPGVRRAALFQHEVQADVDQHPVRFTILVELAP